MPGSIAQRWKCCHQFWIAMVTPNYGKTKIVNRKWLVCTHRAQEHRHPENTQCWCKCLGPLSQENEEYKISTKSLNHQHVSTFFIMIQCLKRSPLNPRPRPRPSSSLASTAALASRSRWTIALWPFSAATSSGVAPQDPARPTRTQDPTKGRKLWKNFGHFRNCDHSKTVLTCLEAMRLFKTSC